MRIYLRQQQYIRHTRRTVSDYNDATAEVELAKKTKSIQAAAMNDILLAGNQNNDNGALLPAPLGASSAAAPAGGVVSISAHE